MVKQVQKIEEYYVYEEDDPYFYPSDDDTYDSDEKLVLIACLMLLEQRYRLFQSMTLEQIQVEVDDIIGSLESELIDTAISKISACVESSFNDELVSFGIPIGKYVSQSYSMDDVVKQSITNMCNQLRDEIKLKAMYFEDNMTNSSFSVVPNFKRAIQKLVDGVGKGILDSKELSHREVMKFVYGDDKLYRWLTMNDDKVCDWCLYQQSLPPRPLDEMPLDHPHGRCTVDPIDYTYSDHYLLLLANNEYIPNPSDDDLRWAL